MKSKKLIDISVVIPCYKSEKFLFTVVEELYLEMKKLEKTEIKKFEINLIVDGSPDFTYREACRISEKYNEIRAFELTKNFGQHAAIFAGVEISTMSWILTMDDDGQHPPSEILKLVHAVDNQREIIYGNSLEEEHSLFRNLFSRTAKKLTYRFLNIENAKNLSSFRLFQKSLLDNIDLRNLTSGVVDVALNWNTNRSHAVQIRMRKRLNGNSNYNFRRLSKFAIQMITGYSVKPLRFISYVGFITFTISVFGAFIVLIQSITGRITVPGYTSLAFLILILGSLQVFALGVIGEYIGRIHEKTNGKPQFKIRDSLKILD